MGSTSSRRHHLVWRSGTLTQSRFLVSLITSSLQPPTADAPLRETTPAQCALYKSIECMLSALRCLTYLKRQAAVRQPVRSSGARGRIGEGIESDFPPYSIPEPSPLIAPGVPSIITSTSRRSRPRASSLQPWLGVTSSCPGSCLAETGASPLTVIARRSLTVLAERAEETLGGKGGKDVGATAAPNGAPQ